MLKLFLVFAAVVAAFAPINVTSEPLQAKRQLDDRVPTHLPVKIKIKKEHEECFQDLQNDHWPADFVLEVKNTGDRPIYALSLIWMLADARAPDGTPYGGTLNFGRNEFRTVRGETPKPEDVPIQPGETHVFKLSQPSVGGLESFARDEGVPPLKGVMVYFHFISFGDGTGWEGPEGKTFTRK